MYRTRLLDLVVNLDLDQIDVPCYTVIIANRLQ